MPQNSHRSLRAMIIIVLSLFYPSLSRAQAVDLGIANIPQQTSVWCWVAVVEQIIRWQNYGNGPDQCTLVSAANGFPQPFCCVPPTSPQHAASCVRTGSLQEIQGLIALFGGHYSSIAPPAHPNVLYNTLQSGRAIIMAVRSSPYTGHVVVLRAIVPAPDPLLIINDPMGWYGFSQPVPFSQLAQYWGAAIIVH
jgi:hypothetical protein